MKHRYLVMFSIVSEDDATAQAVAVLAKEALENDLYFRGDTITVEMTEKLSPVEKEEKG